MAQIIILCDNVDNFRGRKLDHKFKWFEHNTEQKSLLVVSIRLFTRTWPLHHLYENCLHSKFQPTYANLLRSNIIHDLKIMINP